MLNYFRYYYGPGLPEGSNRKLFKFLETRWADALVNEGRIQITTIEHCRNDYEAGKGRADPRENIHYRGQTMALMRWIAEGTEDEHAKQGYHVAPGDEPIAGGRLAIKGRIFFEFKQAHDLFVYCVSYYQSRRMEIRFASRDDSWVEIFDPGGFFGAIDAEMAKRGHMPRGLKGVWYRSKFMPPGYAPIENPELIKEPRFSSEYEARACWTPAARPIDKLPLIIPELTKYCRIQRRVLPTAFPLKKASDSIIQIGSLQKRRQAA